MIFKGLFIKYKGITFSLLPTSLLYTSHKQERRSRTVSVALKTKKPPHAWSGFSFNISLVRSEPKEN